MNIPLDILEAMEQESAMNLRESIDFEVMANILISSGWTDVIIDFRLADTNKHQEIIAWTDSNCLGRFEHRHGRWLFERESDAVLFKLKWT